MQAWVLCRLIAHASFPFILKRQVSCKDFYPRAYGIPVRFCSNQQHFQPMIGIPTIITEELRRLAIVVHQNVQVAVIVEIPDSGSAAYSRQLKIRPELVTYILEDAAPHVAKHELRFRIVDIALVEVNVVQHMAAGHEEIKSPVVVIVHESRSELAQVISGVADLGSKSDIVKELAPEILIQPRELRIQVSYHKIESAASPDVPRVRAHACFGQAIHADRHTTLIPDFAKRPVAIIVKQEIGHRVVRNKNILPSIVVIVESHHTEAVARLESYSRRLAYV